jgi:hypothetical protein
MYGALRKAVDTSKDQIRAPNGPFIFETKDADTDGCSMHASAVLRLHNGSNLSSLYTKLIKALWPLGSICCDVHRSIA